MRQTTILIILAVMHAVLAAYFIRGLADSSLLSDGRLSYVTMGVSLAVAIAVVIGIKRLSGGNNPKRVAVVTAFTGLVVWSGVIRYDTGLFGIGDLGIPAWLMWYAASILAAGLILGNKID